MSTPEEAKAEFARVLLMSGYRWVFKKIMISLDIENKLIVIEQAPPHIRVEFTPEGRGIEDILPPEKKEKPPMTFKFLP